MTDAQNSSHADPYSVDYDGARGQQKSRRLQAAGAILLALVLASVLGLRSGTSSTARAAPGSAVASEIPEAIVDIESTHPRSAQDTQEEQIATSPQTPEGGQAQAGDDPLKSDTEPELETAQAKEPESDPSSESDHATKADTYDEERLVPVPIPVVSGTGTPINQTEEDTEPDEDDPAAVGLPVPVPLPLPVPIPLPAPGLPGLPSLPSGSGGNTNALVPVILPLAGGDEEEPLPVAEPEPIIPIAPVIQTTPDGEYWVQLGAFSTSDAGCIVWEDMAAVSPALFDDALKSVLPARSASGNTVYRLRAGAFDTREEAIVFCDELKTTGATCFVIRD